MSYGKTDFNFQGNAGETGGFDHLRSSLNDEIVFGMATCRLFWEALDFETYPHRIDANKNVAAIWIRHDVS